MIKVIKRDGRLKGFEWNRIYTAISKAYEEVCGNYSDEKIKYVCDLISTKLENIGDTIAVEDLQDIIVDVLGKVDKDVAYSYENYRNERTIARKKKTYNDFMTIVDTVSNDITKDNANMNAETPAGMMMKFASETTKVFANDKLISKEARQAMDENYIYIHDKDYYPTKSLTCLQHPLDRILENGFRAGHGSSRPVKRIETSSIIGCISMEQIQNEMHGGQAIPAFDFYNAPAVRMTFKEEIKKAEEYDGKDYSELYDIVLDDYLYKPLDGLVGIERVLQHSINKTVNRVHQSMEAFIHNMNTIHSRGGNQVVFSSLNYGTDTSAEGRCVIRELLNATYEGVGNGETAIFPIQIWKKKRGVNYLPEDRNYDLYKLACKVTAKRFFPNFINLDATFNKSELWDANDPKRYIHECATMGCRTRVFEDMFGIKTSVGRGNLSFSTLNIVKMGIESMLKYPEDKELRIKNFYELLDKYTDIVARQLVDRFEFQATAKKKQFPLLMNGMWNGSEKLDKNDEIREVIKAGTLGVGFIGLAECLVALVGSHHGESEEAQDLGLDIVKFINKKVEGYKEKYKLNFSVLATPAEGLSGNFTKKDLKTYGEIKGILDKKFYTNSNHVPVYYKCTVTHKAKIEAPYHDLTRGGHIFYTELDGDATHNPKSIEKVVDLMDKYNMGYGSVNHTRSRCLNCGYESADVKMYECSKCGSNNVSIIQRITGYLVGTLDSWNEAKRDEYYHRVTHGIDNK